jgi:GNAT superfamily N-acetyltransferase
VFNHLQGGEAEWMARTAEQNRAEALRMIGEGILKGYLAYADGQVVGWCNANDKRAYPHFSRVGGDDEAQVYAVTCFVIDPDRRRQGIARALLRRAISDAAAAGYDYLEAFPVEGGQTCASHYHGHPALLESEGFTVLTRMGDRLCMRKPLKGRPA